eukprot:9385469-Alexandrium_andersonii.AAC.1
MGNADAGSARRSASGRRHSRTMPLTRIAASKASAHDMSPARTCSGRPGRTCETSSPASWRGTACPPAPAARSGR